MMLGLLDYHFIVVIAKLTIIMHPFERSLSINRLLAAF